MPRRVERILGHDGNRREPSAAARTARQSFLGGLTFKEQAKRIWREAKEDDAFDRAAGLAFYFMLAFFPLLIFLIRVLGLFASAQDKLVERGASPTRPPAASSHCRSLFRSGRRRAE